MALFTVQGPRALPGGSTLKNNLVSWWGLQEATGTTRLDSIVTSANDLTDAAVNVDQTTGHVQSFAALFSGTNFLQHADSITLDFSVNFTFAGWINLTDTAALYSPGGKAGEFRLLTFDNTGYKFGIQSQTSFEVVTADTFGVLSSATWYFVIATYDGSFWKVSVGTTSVAPTAFDSVAVSTPISHTSGGFALGAQSSSGGGDIKGILEQWGFWNRILTNDEITQLWNGGAGKSYGTL